MTDSVSFVCQSKFKYTFRTLHAGKLSHCFFSKEKIGGAYQLNQVDWPTLANIRVNYRKQYRVGGKIEPTVEHD